ncbi:SH2 domain-containing protein 7 [Monodelphis domestica]|uniref:SH2 domain-containing protein 7 n=1 Tax=Monodelphis domestica TaxID=13616 RepID=UPI0024E250D1|nr:SH2 domain-containing protein 7 [Monodelphis domestica]
MEDRMRPVDPEKGVIPMDTESQAMDVLKDLALKWFMETQAPLILQNGTLPEWFHGFITRQQTEELLRDKPLGCFLIRLSDRAVGYILSYRGYNRCRHFVINQLQNRRYLISGDTCNHPTLTALISYYQGAKIEPFGETLTTPCPRPAENSLYDAISLNLLMVAPPESTSPSMEKQELGELEYLRSAKDKDPKANSTPKPMISFLHSKKSQEECPWKLSEEDKDFPDEAPPLPERSSSFLMDSMSGRSSGNIVYAELKKKNHKNQSLSLESSDIPSQIPSSGREIQRRFNNLSGEEVTPKTKEAPLVTLLNTTTLPEIKVDPIKKSQTGSVLDSSLPVPISTSPGDRSNMPSPSYHQASPRAQGSPESIGSGQGFAIHAVPQAFGNLGPNKSRDPSPSGTFELMPKMNSSYSLEDQDQVSGSHAYELLPARLPKSAFLPFIPTYNQLESPRGSVDNTYEKIPGIQEVPSPTLPSNPYEQISISKAPETKQPHSHKAEKHRRFFFTDRKNKQ